MAGRLHPTLLRVLCCYGALSPAALVGLPGDLPFSTVHEFFLTLLDDPHFRAYPPSPEFQRSWWKWVVDQLEALLRSDVADTENDEVARTFIVSERNAHVVCTGRRPRIRVLHLPLMLSVRMLCRIYLHDNLTGISEGRARRRHSCLQSHSRRTSHTSFRLDPTTRRRLTSVRWTG
jgi:hypothetical protein